MSSESGVQRLRHEDIQGIVLRSYRMPVVRHFVLRVDDASGAKRLIASLVDDARRTSLQITAAAPWSDQTTPDACFNLGFTWQGLRALQLPFDLDRSFRSFPSFISGAVARAGFLHDIGNSDPENWLGGLAPKAKGSTESDAHLILTLHAQSADLRELRSKELRALFESSPSVTELSAHDGQALPGEKVHFGYRDGMSEPNIEGGFAVLPDSQPVVPACQFVLLDDGDYNVPDPPALGLNGSFAAFRIIEQDVVGFENFLSANSESEAGKEKLAAQMMGRWRNGTPLVLSPDAPIELPDDKLNEFDYVATSNNPDDSLGLRCPIGAHIRRVNPRGVPAPGVGSGHDHRLIRRGLPYGPEYVPGTAPDNQPRGLIGMFICADLFNQFEFVTNDWINRGGFVSGLPLGQKDPLIGSNSSETSQFEIPSGPGQKRVLKGFGSFISTRGGAYLFLPSLSALRFIATH
ncbi:MAG: peroxidase [Candidatus Saccharimonas sp.]|nr:peroxidase [Planctomycetaceae bacterium]